MTSPLLRTDSGQSQQSSSQVAPRPRAAVAAGGGGGLGQHVEFIGLYNCHIVKFSFMTQRIDFESVEAVGLRSNPNASFASSTATTNASFTKRQQLLTPDGSNSPASVAASGVKIIDMPVDTATSSSSGGKAAGGANNDKVNNTNGAAALGSSPPSGPASAASLLATAGGIELQQQDSITMFDSSPLAEHNLMLPSALSREKTGNSDLAGAGTTPAGAGGVGWRTGGVSIADMARQLHRDIELYESQKQTRIWLFRHHPDEGVALFIFTHVNDFLAYVNEKLPELGASWGSAAAARAEEPIFDPHHHNHHHHHQQHHQQQHPQRHPEEDADAAPADQRADNLDATQRSSNNSTRKRKSSSKQRQPQQQQQQQQQQDKSTTSDKSDRTNEQQQHDDAEDEHKYAPPPPPRNATDQDLAAMHDRAEKEPQQPQPQQGEEGGEGEGDKDGKENDEDENVDEADRSSHSTSTVASTDNASDVCYWIDVQCSDDRILLETMRLFPSIRRETFESFRNDSEKHSMRHFSSHGYLAVIYAASCLNSGGDRDEMGGEWALVGGDGHNHPADMQQSKLEAQIMDQNPSAVQEQMARDSRLLTLARKTKMCVIASQNVAFTFHKEPVLGLGNTVKRLTYAFRRGDEHDRDRGQQQQQHRSLREDGSSMMTPGWVLSMLFSQSVTHMVNQTNLPAVTHAVETLDAKILLSSVAAEVSLEGEAGGSSSSSSGRKKGGSNDSGALGWLVKWWMGSTATNAASDMTNPHLVRVARYRRSCAEMRSNLTRKEHLLSLLTSPKCAGVGYMQDAQQRLHDTVPLILRNLTQLDALRELLSQSHSNLLSQISLAQATTSNKMASQMTQLSVVATVTMPLGLITSLLGMNVPIPWQSTEFFTSLTPFAIVVAVIVVWTCASFLAAKYWS